MKDSTLLKLSLSLSLIGLLLLLVLTEFVEPEPLEITELVDNIGKHVYIEGFVESATYKDEVTFFTVSDSKEEILVVLFDKLDEVISEGDKIGVSGEVSLYKGKMEIIADELVCLKCGN